MNATSSSFQSDYIVPSPVGGFTDPQVKWVSVRDKTRTTDFLEDRAAKYLSEANTIRHSCRHFREVFDDWINAGPTNGSNNLRAAKQVAAYGASVVEGELFAAWVEC
jgi:hypothetical protein